MSLVTQGLLSLRTYVGRFEVLPPLDLADQVVASFGAIDWEAAQPGHIIEFEPGIYRETFDLQKSGDVFDSLVFRAKNGPGTVTFTGAEDVETWESAATPGGTPTLAQQLLTGYTANTQSINHTQFSSSYVGSKGVGFILSEAIALNTITFKATKVGSLVGETLTARLYSARSTGDNELEPDELLETLGTLDANSIGQSQDISFDFGEEERAAGSYCVVIEGSYANNTSNYVRLESYREAGLNVGHGTIHESTNNVDGWTNSGDREPYYVLTGNVPPGQTDTFRSALGIDPNRVFVDDVEYYRGEFGALEEGEYAYSDAHLHLRMPLGADPTSAQVSANQREHAFSDSTGHAYVRLEDIDFAGGNGSGGDLKFDTNIFVANGAHHLKWEGCKSRYAFGTGFFSEGSGGDALELINCEASYNSQRGAVAPGNTYTGQRFIGCNISYNELDGILLNSSQGVLRDCTVSHNGKLSNGEYRGWTSGLKPTGARPVHGLVIFPFGTGGRDWLIEDSTFQYNRGSAALVSGVTNILRNNVASNSPEFFSLVNQGAINEANLLENNLCFDITPTAETTHGNATAQPNFGFGVTILGAQGAILKHNTLAGGGVFVGNDGGDSADVELLENIIRVDIDSAQVKLQNADQRTGFVAARNVYFNGPDGNAQVFDWGGGTINFSTWQTAAADSTSLYADPQFVDPDADDYGLLASSPALGLAADGSRVGRRTPEDDDAPSFNADAAVHKLQGITAGLVNGEIVVSFSAPEREPDSTDVFIRTANTAYPTTPSASISDGAATSFTHFGAEANTHYFYRFESLYPEGRGGAVYADFALAPDLPDINVALETRLANSAYSFWCEPLEQFGNILVFGGVKADGTTFVGSLDLATDEYKLFDLHNYDVDEHNVPGVTVKDGQLWVFYCGHGDEGKFFYRVSSDLDVANLGPENTLSTPLTMTYAQAYTATNGDIIAFGRGTFDRWYLWRTTDDGATWTRRDIIRSTDQTYIKTARVGSTDVLNIGAYGQPNRHPDKNLYLYKMNMATGAVSLRDGTSLGNAYDDTTWTPPDFAQLERVFIPTQERIRMMDVSTTETPAFLITEFSDTPDGNQVNRSLHFEDGEWVARDIVAAGIPIEQPAGNNDYYAGLSFSPGSDAVVNLAREDAGTWYVERWALGTQWQLDQEIAQSANKLYRPYEPIGSSAGEYLMYNEARNYETFEIYDADIVIKGVAATELVPEPVSVPAYTGAASTNNESYALPDSIISTSQNFTLAIENRAGNQTDSNYYVHLTDSSSAAQLIALATNPSGISNFLTIIDPAAGSGSRTYRSSDRSPSAITPATPGPKRLYLVFEHDSGNTTMTLMRGTGLVLDTFTFPTSDLENYDSNFLGAREDGQRVLTGAVKLKWWLGEALTQAQVIADAEDFDAVPETGAPTADETHTYVDDPSALVITPPPQQPYSLIQKLEPNTEQAKFARFYGTYESDSVAGGGFAFDAGADGVDARISVRDAGGNSLLDARSTGYTGSSPSWYLITVRPDGIVRQKLGEAAYRLSAAIAQSGHSLIGNRTDGQRPYRGKITTYQFNTPLTSAEFDAFVRELQ